MKIKNILPLAAAVMLLASCADYSTHVLRGTLYEDSTMSTPLSGRTLDFYEHEEYSDFYGNGKYLGSAVSDEQGRWAFMYTRNMDTPHYPAPAEKLQVIEYLVLIVSAGDTLYFGQTERNLNLYPGINWNGGLYQ